MLSVFFLFLVELPTLAGWSAKVLMFRAMLISTGPTGGWMSVIVEVNAVVPSTTTHGWLPDQRHPCSDYPETCPYPIAMPDRSEPGRH